MIDHSMDSEGQASNNEQGDKAGLQRRAPLILLNVILMALGNTGGPLLVRLYFRCGGKRRWLSSWLGTAGWPVILLTLFCSYLRCRLSGRHTKLFFITPRLVLSCAAVGLLTGMDDFLYVYGLSFLPVSTSALLVSTQLAFTALFSFLLVKQRFTAYSINAVGLLTVGAAILGLHVRSDRQENETRREYYVGFALTLAAAALYGLILPLMELMYAKAKQAITYTLVLEMQLAIGIFASSFCMGGMLLNKDFQAIPEEAKEFGLGKVRYYLVLVCSAVFWQFFFLGTVGVIFCVNTLLAGVLIAVFIPVTELLGVVFLRERFSSEKGMALVLALWGLASYSYGEYRRSEKEKEEKAALDHRNVQIT
ncbi:purine permease 3-like isoform X1 [Curcuma longa]|uniref:purine permease 3-like isoform X1 n=1 Tax=Curcuma longa TaxID=136217 RepID=UPI003D9F2617